MLHIAEFITREIINFRGNPMVEVDVILSDGTLGRAAVPYRTPLSMDEQAELHDANERGLFGKEIIPALENVKSIAAKLVGMDALDQAGVDHIMMEDGRHNKESVGANASLGVSLAVAKATAASLNMPLCRYISGVNTLQMPVPMINLLSGGEHAANNLDFREFMIVPVVEASIAEIFRMCTEVYHALKNILRSCGRNAACGDTGTFAPNLLSNEEALAVLCNAIHKAGYKPGKQFALAINVAASDFFAGGEYNFTGEGFIKTPTEMVEYYTGLMNEYPIIAIEDGMARDDHEGRSLFYRHLGDKVQLLGYDIFAANVEQAGRRMESKMGKSILIKVTQVATLSDILDRVKRVKEAGYSCVIANCSSEAEDPVIADIAVGVNAARIKVGPPARTNQVAVYNRLLRIEEDRKTIRTASRRLGEPTGSGAVNLVQGAGSYLRV
jgi:enolase